jgi:hypothetical protein
MREDQAGDDDVLRKRVFGLIWVLGREGWVLPMSAMRLSCTRMAPSRMMSRDGLTVMIVAGCITCL